MLQAPASLTKDYSGVLEDQKRGFKEGVPIVGVLQFIILFLPVRYPLVPFSNESSISFAAP